MGGAKLSWAQGRKVPKYGPGCTGFCWGNLRERDHLEDPGTDEEIILRWIFRKWDGGGGQ